jgi:16S rRNA (guanine527-N7)-methyltransferase
MIVTDVLERGVNALGIEVRAAQLDQLDRYLSLIEKRNRVYNLTAIRERDRMVTHHLLDSLAIVPYVRGPRVLDVGSGAGLPGIPLAIANAKLHVTLLDSNQKKAAFLRQAIAELRISNADVQAERVESWRTEAGFETIVARAFSDLAMFVTSSRHLLAPQGVFIAMKGTSVPDEIARLPAWARVQSVAKLNVPELDAERHLVLIECAA